MSHLKDIMLLKEEEMDRAVFAREHQEGGINTVYDPLSDKDVYQVFVHQNFPMRELSSWEFDSFREARNFAATQFKEWEMLLWSQGVNRPCGSGGGCSKDGCGSKKNAEGVQSEGTSSGGSCGGGCSTCGATKEFDELLNEKG
jgi:hypothetical protein